MILIFVIVCFNWICEFLLINLQIYSPISKIAIKILISLLFSIYLLPHSDRLHGISIHLLTCSLSEFIIRFGSLSLRNYQGPRNNIFWERIILSVSENISLRLVTPFWVDVGKFSDFRSGLVTLSFELLLSELCDAFSKASCAFIELLSFRDDRQKLKRDSVCQQQ